jgi:stress-induced morphogen
MIQSNALAPEVIREHLNNYLIINDKQVQVSVKHTSLGWLKIRIITTSFEGKTLVEREEKIDALLNNLQLNLNLGQYPISGYELLTTQEAVVVPTRYIQLPLWSDILMAPEPDTRVEEDEDIPKKPLVVTFYSFNGGVGRSTALGIVAGILASRNRRVVVIDFDLEAPGISIMLQTDIESTTFTHPTRK